MIIAIDGPAGSGKTTIGRMVAERLGFALVDTGLLYRAVTVEARRRGIGANDATGLVQMLAELHIEINTSPRADRDSPLLQIDGRDVSREAHDPAIARSYPFDVLGAQTQGMIGYWLVQALQNALPGRQVACLVSRTLVRRDDPAFAGMPGVRLALSCRPQPPLRDLGHVLRLPLEPGNPRWRQRMVDDIGFGPRLP